MLGARNTLLERRLAKVAVVLFAAAAMTVLLGAQTTDISAEGQGKGKLTEAERITDANAQRMLAEGKQTFVSILSATRRFGLMRSSSTAR